MLPQHDGSTGSVLRAAGVALLALAAMTSCAETVTQLGDGDIVELRLTPDSAELGVGRTLRVRAVPLDETGALLTNRTVSWQSSNASVATVDEDGLVTAVSAGTADIVATAASLQARAAVTVRIPPILTLSDDAVAFTTTAGGADPDPDSVQVTNTGEIELVGLAIDSVVYTAGTGWLAPELGSAMAPATLRLQVMATGLTTAGTYTAVVWLSGVDADNSPAAVQVTLDVTAGAPATLAISAGDGQSAAAGSSVPVAPAVLVTDAFDNPVAGVEVAFAVGDGGGSLTGAVATSDASGVATVGSWTLGTTAGENTLTASVGALDAVEFSATGVPGAATRLEVNDGDGQSAVAGAAVAVAPSVVALDDFDNGVPGVSVTFEVTQGDGSVGSATQTTDSDGVARVGSWTLGTSAGANTLRALASSIPDSVFISATGLSGTAVAIQLEAGDAQTDTVAATLAAPYQVKVVDVNGNGVAGIPVSWAVTGGGGSVGGASMTDADGIASTTRVLGTTAGNQSATGAVGGLTGSPVAFTATALPGAPAVVEEVVGDGQTATVATQVSVAPSVRVEDQFDNPIAGHSVTFAVTGGGGSVMPASAVQTGADGIAAVTSWTLGTTAGIGNNTLQATATGAGLTGNPASFTATATADAPASIEVVSGNGQTAVTGVNVANPPTARVLDQYDNPVPSVTVAFSASGGGSAGSPTGMTSATGMASSAWTVSTTGATMGTDGTFANTLTATVQGTAISTAFDGLAIYSYQTHVDPIFGPAAEGCSGCHGGVSGLELGGTAAQNYAELVNVVPVCGEGGLATQYRVVSPAGGLDASEDFSILMRFIDPSLSAIGLCADSKPAMAMEAQYIQIIRAWIRNGAPFN